MPVVTLTTQFVKEELTCPPSYPTGVAMTLTYSSPAAVRQNTAPDGTVNKEIHEHPNFTQQGNT